MKKRIVDHKYAPSRGVTLICHPDDAHKTLVGETGELLYDFAACIPAEGDYWFNRVYRFGLWQKSRPVHITQSTENAKSAIVKTVIEYPKLTLTLTTFSHRLGSTPSDIVIWDVSSRSDIPQDTAVWVEAELWGRTLVLPDGEEKSRYIHSIHALDRRIPHLDLELPYKSQTAEHNDLAREEFECYSVKHPLHSKAPLSYGPTARMQSETITVTQQERVTGAFIFPLHGKFTDEPDMNYVYRALNEERAFWESYPCILNGWSIPDEGIMDMITACARNISQAREEWNGLAEFQVGPTCYRGLWVVDGHFILEAARYLGHESAKNQGIEALLRRVRDSGAIAQFVWHLKETGISIATLIRQCELSDDWNRIEELWDTIMAAVGYIRRLREQSLEGGEQAPEYGLMPPTFSDGGASGERGEYTTTLWTLIGLSFAQKAAKRLGKESDARLIEYEFSDLLQSFYEKIKRDEGFLHDGTPYIPMIMPDTGEHTYEVNRMENVSKYYRINPSTATWALAQAIYPGEIFREDDPLIKNFCHLLDLLDDEEGIPANTGWLPYRAVWNYSASFYAHAWLYSGNAEKAIDYLYDFANHATPTRVWREEQSLRTQELEQFVGDMPHNWASAEFIRLVRALLVFEKGDNLFLLSGVPKQWLIVGKEIRLTDTPTRYGFVDITLTIEDSSSAVLTYSLQKGRDLKPKQIIVSIPATYSTVSVDGKIIEPKDKKIVIPDLEDHVLRFMV